MNVEQTLLLLRALTPFLLRHFVASKLANLHASSAAVSSGVPAGQVTNARRKRNNSEL